MNSPGINNGIPLIHKQELHQDINANQIPIPPWNESTFTGKPDDISVRPRGDHLSESINGHFSLDEQNNRTRGDIEKKFSNYVTSESGKQEKSQKILPASYQQKVTGANNFLVINGEKIEIPPMSPSMLAQIQKDPQALDQFAKMSLSEKVQFVAVAESLSKPGNSFVAGKEMDDRLMVLLREGKMSVYYELQEKGNLIRENGSVFKMDPKSILEASMELKDIDFEALKSLEEKDLNIIILDYNFKPKKGMDRELLETCHQYFLQDGRGAYYDNRHHTIVHKLEEMGVDASQPA